MIAVCCLCAACAWCGALAMAEDWPALPDKDGDALIPAQEWPFEPGARQVKVYVWYPGGTLDNVDGDTGLMLNLHNWGGTGWVGTADPAQLVDRYRVVVISVDYLQSGPYDEKQRNAAPYDFGYLQALDALRALYFVWNGLEGMEKPFARGRIYCTGGSGGGNVTLMANKLAPRTFACAVDCSGMAKLADDIAYGIPGRTSLNAGYGQDKDSPAYLSPDAQDLRFVGNPGHLKVMKDLGNACRMLVIHGMTDASCPFEDAREMAINMQNARLAVSPHFISDADVDGKVFTGTGHSLGDRTVFILKIADPFLKPDSPDLAVRAGATDFELRDTSVRYPTANGTWVISYENGYPVGEFRAK